MKRGLVFITLLLFLVSFSFVLADNDTNVTPTLTAEPTCPLYHESQSSGWCENGTIIPSSGLDENGCEMFPTCVELEAEDTIPLEDEEEDEDEEESETEVEIEFNGKKLRIKEKYKHAIQTRNRLRFNASGECPGNCECEGQKMQCEFEGERKMIIQAGNSGNTIVQVKGINASTKVELFKDGEKVYGLFRNNETKEIMLPDHIQEKIRQRIQAHLEDETLELDEDGNYEYRARKQAKLFWMFKVKEKVKMDVNAETGEIERIRNSWWGWLARDIPEEVNETQ